MITLEHVRLLETRVEKALAYIDRLKAENGQLREKLSGYESRVAELESAVKTFRAEQGRIEEGIIHALEKLNRFEDAISQTPPAAATTVGEGIAVKAAPSVSPTVSAVPEAGGKQDTVSEETPVSEDAAADAAYWDSSEADSADSGSPAPEAYAAPADDIVPDPEADENPEPSKDSGELDIF